MATYFNRSLEPTLLQASKTFSGIVLTGPRQSGKTTLLKHLFNSTHKYVSLEPPDVRNIATNDPRGFLNHYSPPIIFDEIQYAPELLPYIKEEIDANRNIKGQYILTGSQNLLLLQSVTESLAGRVAILKLFPLAQREIDKIPDKPPIWDNKNIKQSNKKINLSKLWSAFLCGYYPELIANKKLNVTLWHASYIQTYLERDVRSLRQIGDLSQFQNFLRLLAARNAQLLNLSDLASNLGLAVNTVKAWLSILEATYQIIILRPYFNNIGKRLVKLPKIYFTDIGTLCYLVGLKDPEHAAYGPMAGAIFETAVLTEIIKTMLHQGIEPQIYFWRTADGAEVDILVNIGQNLIPIEVKLSSTPKISMAKHLQKFISIYKNKIKQSYIIYPGNNTLPLGEKILAIPFAKL